MLNVHFHACPKENKIKGGKEIHSVINSRLILLKSFHLWFLPFLAVTNTNPFFFYQVYISMLNVET